MHTYSRTYIQYEVQAQDKDWGEERVQAAGLKSKGEKIKVKRNKKRRGLAWANRGCAIL